MKKEFFDHMHTVMESNPDVYFLMLGLGWPRLDEFLAKYPGRAFNLEASEQSGLDVAVGLAYAGKIPVIYTITPFYLRAFETIRTYLNHECLHVIIIGAGRDDDYSKHDGYSHEAGDIGRILATQENIQQYYPNTVEQLKQMVHVAVENTSPAFISIRR